MKTPFFLAFVLFQIIACHSGVNSHEPQAKQGTTAYNIDEFESIPMNELNDVWLEMNHAKEEVGVFMSTNGVVFKDPVFDYPYYFNMTDGKLEVKNRGEFGGEFNFIPSDSLKDTIRILNTNVVSVFSFEGEIYILQGIAHMMDQGGQMSRLLRSGDTFELDSVLSLSSAPEAMAIYNDRLIIAGHRNLTVIRNFEIETCIPAFWDSLYPNMVVPVSDDEIYIGFRAGYAKFSLEQQSIKYYKLKSITSVV